MPKVFVTGTRGMPGVMGGVETHCEELYPRLAAMGIDVTVARRSTYVNDNLSQWHGVKLIDIATPRKKSLEAIVHTWRAINKAHSMGADIVHVHSIGPALLTPWARLLGMKVVFTHHGPDYERDKWGRAARIMLRLGERMGCHWANEVVVISSVIEQLIATRHGRTQGVHLIYNGVSQPEPCDYPDYFAELGIEPDKYILAMCRFVPEKNLHHLLKAFATVENKPAGMRLVLAGDADHEDDYSRSLKQQARDGNVVLTGMIKGRRLHSLLTHCRAFCLPSSHEGLPIALLEAMSYGAPVIVSDIPANLAVNLPSHCYFPCGDIPALTAKLQEIIATPYSTTTYDLTPYSWDTIAPQVADIYQSLAK